MRIVVASRRAHARRVGSVCASFVLLGALGAIASGCTKSRSASNADPQSTTEQGGTGTRARNEEGVMGTPAAASAVAASPGDGLRGEHQYGVIGRLGQGGGYDHGTGAGATATPTATGIGNGNTSPALRAYDQNAKPKAAWGRESSTDLPAPPPTQALLDPNARFATTYRPGGAALAAFDAALARGSIPAADKDLVGDFGARYAPSIDVPDGAAMAFLVETERSAASPSGGAMNLRIAMRSTDAMPSRAPLSVHLVLDVSGSMSGAAIANARDAAEALVNKLEPTDDFSMVTFSSDAQVIIPDGPIGPRRQMALAKIHEVHADGGTNISSGLDLGYAQAHAASVNPDAVKIVMLLSDGHANAGDTNAASLAMRSANAFQDGIQTSSFGLGADFDAPLMSSFADRGAGGYYYLADSTQISWALERELDERLVPAAQAVEVRVRLRPDIGATKVFGSRQLSDAEAWNVRQQEINVDNQTAQRDGIAKDRQDDAKGGMRFFIPAFARSDHDSMVISLQLPAGVGVRAIASVEVKYKDRIAKKNVTQEIPVRIHYAESDGDSAATANVSVEKSVQLFAAGDAILDAAQMIDRGDRAGAARVLDERADILKQASTDLNEPELAEEGMRLARLESAVTGTDAVQDPVPLAIVLRASGYGSLK
jgi:Ca-activated chloride channel family protein